MLAESDLDDLEVVPKRIGISAVAKPVAWELTAACASLVTRSNRPPPPHTHTTQTVNFLQRAPFEQPPREGGSSGRAVLLAFSKDNFRSP